MMPLRRRLVIDNALPGDADGLAELHQRSFHHAWTGDDFAAFLKEENVTCFVARLARRLGRPMVAGFLLMREAADEAEVLTIAVAPACRRRGYGRQLLEHGMRHLYRQRMNALFLEVDEGNQPAMALYRALGFREVGRRQGYYAVPGGGTSSALVMRVQLR